MRRNPVVRRGCADLRRANPLHELSSIVAREAPALSCLTSPLTDDPGHAPLRPRSSAPRAERDSPSVVRAVFGHGLRCLSGWIGVDVAGAGDMLYLSLIFRFGKEIAKHGRSHRERHCSPAGPGTKGARTKGARTKGVRTKGVRTKGVRPKGIFAEGGV